MTKQLRLVAGSGLLFLMALIGSVVLLFVYHAFNKRHPHAH